MDILLCDPEAEETSLGTLRAILDELKKADERLLFSIPSGTRERSSIDIVRKEWQHILSPAKVGSENMDHTVKAFCLLTLPGRPPRRVDIVLIPRSQWGTQLLGWSGTRQFLRFLKRFPMEKKPPLKLRVSNHGLFLDNRKIGGPDAVYLLTPKPGVTVQICDDAAMAAYVADQSLHFQTEEEVFAAIGAPYCPPEHRFC